jgi:NADH-quinone oxidoreductase subunit G
MPTLSINGREVTVPKGTPIIRAAAQVGINIPHFCYHPALSAPANCRMCLVEVEKARKLEPACYLKCTDGMVVHTESEKVLAVRKSVLEFILLNHPVDCPICDQAGECKLQDYYVAYDAEPSRLSTQKVGKAKVYPIGPHVVLDAERCILCTRCIRFCDQVTGTSELTMIERGDRVEIRTFPGKELDNAYSMNVTDICPVGALTTKDFRFKCRVWLLTSTDSICTGCAKGCNIHLDHFRGETQRYRPRFNAEVNEYWMCDSGRLSYKDLHTDRLLDIKVEGDAFESWPRAARKVAGLLAKSAVGPRTAFVVSARASTESLLAAREFAATTLGGATVYWAGRPDGESDEFLIQSDRNPNRAGLAHVFGEGVLARDASSLLAELERGNVDAVYMMGSALPLDTEARNRFVDLASKTGLFVLQAAHKSDLANAAHVFLPAATHAEQDSTFVNADGIAQPAYRAYPPAGNALPHWEIFFRLARASDNALPWSDFASLQDALFEAEAAE